MNLQRRPNSAFKPLAGICTLLLLIVTAQAAAAPGTRQHSRRHLTALGNAYCPEGCTDDGCVPSSTPGGLRCNRCQNNLVVNLATGRCVCTPGSYSTPNSSSCAACSKGHFCPGGDYSGQNTSSAPEVPCAANMTTLGRRSTSQRSCVNLPGFSYTLDEQGIPAAVLCPADSWSPGLKKQRACVPCPAGFSTNARAGATAPTACVVPSGSYLKAPGVAAPCPRGEFKAGLSNAGNCSQCTFGVTTAEEGSTSESACSVLLPGFYAAAIAPSGAVRATGTCPQGFVCQGGKPTHAFDPANPSALLTSEHTIQACLDGMWTKEPGARSAQECATPPGHFTADGKTSKCPEGSYRADWKTAGQATACVACGEGVLALATDTVTKYARGGNKTLEVAVTSSAEDCYIRPGQGLLFSSLNNTWRASDCMESSYGVANITYGLSPSPCRACPSGTEAKASWPKSAKYLAYRGFTSERGYCSGLPWH